MIKTVFPLNALFKESLPAWQGPFASRRELGLVLLQALSDTTAAFFDSGTNGLDVLFASVMSGNHLFVEAFAFGFTC